MDNLITVKKIEKYQNGRFFADSDMIVNETSITINVNRQRLVSIACLPQNQTELAIGFIFSEGIILSQDEILSCEYNPDDEIIDFKLKIEQSRINNFLQTGEKTSGCGSTLSAALSGKKTAFPQIRIKPDDILQKMQEFQRDSDLFKKTGGVHRVGLVRNNEIVLSVDDIGRHNAVDKVAGMAVIHKFDLKEFYLLCSGRISSEIVKKCVRLGIPLIVSHSAPTSKAIRLGWDYKIYLIGFARGDRFNIYTGYEEKLFSFDLI